MGRTVICVSRADHDLGKVRTIGGHDAICHKAPEGGGVNHRADDVLAKDSERGHVLCGGSPGLVCLRRMQRVDANAMPVHDKRVAIDRCGLTFNDGRLLPSPPEVAGRTATAAAAKIARHAEAPGKRVATGASVLLR